LAKRHQDLLAGLDQIGLKRYHITEKDVRTVEKYLSIIQAGLQVEGTYAELVQGLMRLEGS
jgi:hypothetical protein